ncbi:MAG: TonB-dependent receptor [Rhodobacteraceae bacterium]|nr:MAG: TonB-dependent receptor [Paracoccaceae bacterium]
MNDFVDSRVTFIDFDTATFAPGTGLVVGGTTRTENVDARLWGFEAEAAYDAGPWFASLSGMIPRGENRSGGPLGSIPQDRLNLGLGWRPAPGVTLGARGTFARGQSRVPEGGQESDGFSVVDLFASYAPESGPLAGAVFRAGVDNLFDRDHRIHPNGLDQPGRSFKISAAFTF